MKDNKVRKVKMPLESTERMVQSERPTQKHVNLPSPI